MLTTLTLHLTGMGMGYWSSGKMLHLMEAHLIYICQVRKLGKIGKMEINS